MFASVHIISLIFIPCLYGLSRIDPLVDTKQGLIRGLRSDNGQYAMFLGIPYARVDDENPFGPAVPQSAFDGTFEAFDDSAICPQMSTKTNTVVGTIDCLRLNVFVPNTATSKNRLPVMFWLHSGGFVRGSGNRVQFGPDFLVRHNVIIVSINYRLGPYGFLCLDTPTVSGNQGLKDQFLALKWVHENIESFGGDASKVTLFGESAGAKSVHLHLLSDNVKLYDKAIIQSSAVVTPWPLVKPDNSKPIKIAEKLGFETDNIEDALTFLASQDVDLVVGASHEIGISKYVGIVLPETRPCIENQVDGSYITDYPFNIHSSKVKNMPIMIGYTGQEMLYKFGNADADIFTVYSFEDRLKSGLDLIDNEMVDLVKHFYIGDANADITLKDQILNFESDFNYNHPIDRTIQRYRNEGAKAIYYYVFDYEGGRNYMKVSENITSLGVTHADELGYLFASDLLNDEPTTEDQKLIDRMTTMWTNFAKHGEPTPELTDLLPVKWIPVDGTSQNYLQIDSEVTLLKRPFHQRLAFWDLFYKLNGESQDGEGNRRT